MFEAFHKIGIKAYFFKMNFININFKTFVTNIWFPVVKNVNYKVKKRKIPCGQSRKWKTMMTALFYQGENIMVSVIEVV